LIVDDSISIRTCVRNLLYSLQAEILEVKNGLQGLEIANSQHLDLIITDVEMPGMDGFELCRTLKKAKFTSDIPVVILSSRESDSDIEKGFKVGAGAYVGKSNGKDNLLPRVQSILGKYLMRGKHVMIVDDSSFILKTLSRGMIQNGFRVSNAKMGKKRLLLCNRSLQT